jgi:hypothetical protein
MTTIILVVFLAILAVTVLSALWDWKNDPPKSGGSLDGGGEGGGYDGGGFFDGGHGGHGDGGGGGGHH